MFYKMLVSGSVIGLLFFSIGFMAGRGKAASEFNQADKSMQAAMQAASVVQAETVPESEVTQYVKGPIAASLRSKKFYIFGPQNHYVASGRQGDTSDLKYSEGWKIKIDYNLQKKLTTGEAGICWQDPINNWGNKKGGMDLTGAKKITFLARGEKGGEVITQFHMGGLQGQYGDTASAKIGPFTLDIEWKQYTIDLRDKDLSRVVAGFGFLIRAADNPDGATFYLDQIAYE